MDKLKPCPFCGMEDFEIWVCDCEGNYHGHLGCDYEKDPWSGLRYGLMHPNSECVIGDCVFCLYTSLDELVADWNARFMRCEAVVNECNANIERICEVSHVYTLFDCDEHVLTCGHSAIVKQGEDCPKYCPSCGAKIVD